MKPKQIVKAINQLIRAHVAQEVPLHKQHERLLGYVRTMMLTAGDPHAMKLLHRAVDSGRFPPITLQDMQKIIGTVMVRFTAKGGRLDPGLKSRLDRALRFLGERLTESEVARGVQFLRN